MTRKNTTESGAAKTGEELDAADAIEARLRSLCSEDDFAHGLTALEHYPEIRTRALSLFEQDLRDWGLVYGLAFGLALSANPQMAHEDAAQLAYWPARRVYGRWAGEIEDPGEKREAAIRALVQRYHEDELTLMTASAELHELHDAIADVVESARA
jgi:hypothetical protein